MSQSYDPFISCLRLISMTPSLIDINTYNKHTSSYMCINAITRPYIQKRKMILSL